MLINLYKNYGDPSESTSVPAPYTLKNDTFTRSGYVLYAWNTKSNGSGKSYKSGDEVAQDSTSDKLDLYAQWKSVIPTYRIPVYGDIQCICNDIFGGNETSREFSPIVINSDNELSIDINGQVVPFKYSTVSSSGNTKSIFINDSGEYDNNWSTGFNGRYHIYDGDLPYIDIQLLCQSNTDYKLATSMIQYDKIAIDKDSGTISGSGNNSVTADNLKAALGNLMDYLKSNSIDGDNVFWTQSVPVTN